MTQIFQLIFRGKLGFSGPKFAAFSNFEVKNRSYIYIYTRALCKEITTNNIEITRNNIKLTENNIGIITGI